MTGSTAGIGLAIALAEAGADVIVNGRTADRVIFLASESAFNAPLGMIHYGVSRTADVAVERGLPSAWRAQA